MKVTLPTQDTPRLVHHGRRRKVKTIPLLVACWLPGGSPWALAAPLEMTGPSSGILHPTLRAGQPSMA